ncbi:MAG: hypothetical protein JNK67_27095 [Alphaproteobacteria bacterium]|nr:hypothetical protein [Alphaproteobacteria bacterium]
MALLNPDPHQLGLASPELGPWFKDESDATLPNLIAPGVDLAVALSSFPSGMQWRAPAGCTASYFIATAPRPAGLAGLRQADGSQAFAPGALVVLATLLPEVELRLAALSNVIPSPDGVATPAGAPGRPVVRHLAIEVPAGTLGGIATIGALREGGFPPDVTDPADQAAYVGLNFEGGVLGNARRPARELHRPSFANKVILENNTGGALTGLKLWAFDDRGRALDPGAVANWWSYLASGSINPLSGPPFGNLWADPLGTGNQATAGVVAGRVVLFCGPSEGPASSAHVARLNLSGLTSIGASTTLFTAGTGPAVALRPPSTTNDDMPMPRIGMLPNGPFGAPGAVPLFNGWTGGAFPAALTRDFARIAVTDIEADLVGLTRSVASQADSDTRIVAAANTAAAPFLTTSDAATTQIMTTLRTGAVAVAMAPVMDVAWGAVAAPAFGAGARPDALAFTVHALRGAGTASGDTVAGQQIVVRFPSGSLPASAWVRVWPHGLDTTTGERFQLDGGGGLADAGGRAFVVVPLPDGSADGPLSFDALVTTQSSSRFYLEQRFDRPALDGSGGAIGLPAPPGLPAGFVVWMCEQGAALPRTTFGGLLGGGVTLLGIPPTGPEEETGTYAPVDMTTVDPTDYLPATLLNAATAGDQLIVTTPAFVDGPIGNVPGATPAVGAAVTQRNRNLFAPVAGLGNPPPTLERREVFAVDPAAPTGIVAGIATRARDHEAIPAQLGHPGVPAGVETHGAGLAIAGPVTVELIQLMRERAATTLFQLINAASVNIPTPATPGGTTMFSAVLETIAQGVAGDAATRILAQAPTFAPGQSWDDLKAWIEGIIGDIDGFIDPVIADDTLAAAVDRLILKTRDGAAQAATALQAAIARAEDFVYLETPAIDALSAGGGSVDIVKALTDRIAQRPNLIVILCVPERFLPGQPAKLEAVRKSGIRAALKALADASPANVALFTPSAGLGRRLHMASTTAIVDDAFMLTGTTHLWRRGLTFDSSLAVSLFDDRLALGRPATVRAARLQLIADRLGLPANFSPLDPAHVVDAIRRLEAAGGLRRVVPGAYAPAADTTVAAELLAWNPDGRPGGTTDWYLYFVDVVDGAATGINTAIR